MKMFLYNIRSIKFSEDSAVNTIFYYAFLFSNIEEIYFPTSLRELREGWCYGADKLTKIIISPSNCHFTFNEDKYLSQNLFSTKTLSIKIT